MRAFICQRVETLIFIYPSYSYINIQTEEMFYSTLLNERYRPPDSAAA
jgi:hypothetical protein